MAAVLDSSAILAFLLGEPGADCVERYLGRETPGDAASGVLCVVNLVEVLEVLPGALESPLFGMSGLVEVVGVTEAQARWAASIKERTRPAGLSLGDRLCLALAHETRREVLTADRAWAKVALGVPVIQIRGSATTPVTPAEVSPSAASRQGAVDVEPSSVTPPD